MALGVGSECLVHVPAHLGCPRPRRAESPRSLVGVARAQERQLEVRASTYSEQPRFLLHPSNTIAIPSTMSWRTQAGSTGSNNIPLGTRRRPGEAPSSTPDFAPSHEGKRGRSPEPVPKEPELNPDGTKKRRKRNRWGDASDNKAAGLMNLPTAITAPMTAEQLDAYVTHLRIEEISQKLRINDVVPADGDR
jgi:hypothetical protein